MCCRPSADTAETSPSVSVCWVRTCLRGAKH
uniref:Uncharacterized protein n=1 Tax=Timema douglasi TaxID=61478 RepID=A0A7R8ZEH5_TIMDO|nr:unnamed protein product [Timema douglasi]